MPERALSTWLGIDAALAPVIGHGGVIALYRRSLALRRPDFPWLAALPAEAREAGEFAALEAALSRYPPAQASAANHALLRTFRGLLSTLIGHPLAHRLLQTGAERSPP